ncbi:MAG TPA: hypothetical protein VIX89_14650 [Bryobacteraceae bacterium]
MSISRTPTVIARVWTGIATCMLLFVASAIVQADDKKPAAVKAPAAAPAPPPKVAAPAAAKPAAPAPARTVPNVGRPTGVGGGTHPPANNTGGRPAGVPAGVGAGTNPAHGAGAPAAAPGRPGWNNNPNGNTGVRPGWNNNPNSRPGGGNPNVPSHAGNSGGSPATSHAPIGVTRGSNGKVQSYRGANGSEAHFGRDGSVHEVRRGNTVITHGPGGSRHIMSERADHSRIVTNRAGHGYVQRPFSYRGHEYAHRTYYYQGAAYPRYYRTYSYRGVYLETYAPVRYYSPAFYGWVYHPWVTPVYYSWGFASAPWYGYYGGYFAPYQSYPSASFWLTDYLVSQSLTEAYQEQVDASANLRASAFVAGNGQTGLTPDVKQELANEVQRQLALENAEGQTVAKNAEIDPASSGLPRLLSDNNPHTFVVSSNLSVTDSTGQECSITRGDVILMSGTSLADGNLVPVQVRASKNQECAKGSTVSVSLEDLQDMENHMRATIDQGLGELQSHPAQSGLPAPPPSATAPPVQAAFAALAPPVDPNVSTELNQEAHNADQVEQQVISESQSGQPADNPGAASAPPLTQTPTISLGQTIDQVVAILGNPLQIADLGAKKIYKFKDMKITFVNGRVSDVQ